MGRSVGLAFAVSPGMEALTAEVRQTRFFALTRRCFQAAAKEQPLLIVLEDAHWADQSSRALLDDLTQSLEGHAMFVAVTFRLLEDLHLATLEAAVASPSSWPICLPRWLAACCANWWAWRGCRMRWSSTFGPA
ncbi:MAG: AAA family ATPase [Chloroflexi bacterium]|nr:AAA family ATPase [Chloroflexota bacterium]